MLGILFLVGSAAAGVCFVRRMLRDLLTAAEQIFWGVVIGWTLTTIAVYFGARWHGQLTSSLIWMTTIAVWLITAALIVWEARHPIRASSLFEWHREYFGLALVLAVFTPAYFGLFSSHMFAPGPGGVYSGGGAWYDLSFHTAIASSFLYGNNLAPIYTLLPPEPLLYPYLPDFQIALLMGAGLSLRATLMLTSLLLAVATTGLFYSFAWRIARSQKSAALATILFLLNGGLGFIYFFLDWWNSGKGLAQFWNTLDANYAAYPARGIYWTNLINLFPAQRTILFGIPIGLLVFTVFVIVWQRWNETETTVKQVKPSTEILMLIAGGLTGILPYFHTHTYIAVGVVSVVLFLLRPRRPWLIFWLPSVLLAAPQLWSLSRHAAGASVLRFLPGWLGHNESFLPRYLIRDFGLLLLLVVPAWIAAPKLWKKFYLGFLALFVFALTVIVSPNAFDNGKLIYYWHALNSVLVASWLTRIARQHWQKIITAVVALMCTATGIMALQCESHNWSRVFSDQDMEIANYVREKTSPRSLFLTAPVFNQPALCLAGRAVLLGPPAWLWSHGYDFREREADVRRIYAGTTDALELIRYYNVDYIYVGDAERRQLQANESFFDDNFAAAYRNDGVTIYDARAPRSSPANSSESRSGALNQPAPRELALLLDRDPYALLVQFPRTSFFSYRLIKATYGRMPRREELIAAMTVIYRGVFLRQSGWENQIEANRISLLNAWINSKEFRQAYESKTDAEFVNVLLSNAGLNWSGTARDALVDKLQSKQVSRQAALSSIVEDHGFFASEYNTAYVLMHFFGYLRRNPDDPPDGDLRGLIFWRDNLDTWGDYLNISRAFVESIEYNNLKPPP